MDENISKPIEIRLKIHRGKYRVVLGGTTELEKRMLDCVIKVCFHRPPSG